MSGWDGGPTFEETVQERFPDVSVVPTAEVEIFAVLSGLPCGYSS